MTGLEIAADSGAGKTNYDLFLSLLRADSEEEVTQILKKNVYIDSDQCWLPFGATEGNWSIAGNQSSSSVGALADKIMNSIDAVLLDACYARGIDPESPQAPDSMEEAVELFFGVKEGDLSFAKESELRSLYNNILLVSTGAKPSSQSDMNPCYTLIDKGEGQEPSKMSSTLLSLPTRGKTNKSRVRFVQGVFNMGGTGVLPFCGKINYELIASKRCPSANSQYGDQDSSWSFTIVRRRRPEGNERMSVYQYLAPRGSLLTFQADSIPVLPAMYPNPYSEPLEHGTVIKLYEYKIRPKALRGPASLDLNYELSRHFYKMAVPVRICERREGYVAHSTDATLSGLSTRLDANRSSVIEDGFPIGDKIPVDGLGQLPVTVFVFKREIGHGITSDRNRWMADKSIIFTLNGQLHASYKKDFFARETVDLGYLQKDMLVIVDISEIPPDKREDLLMPSRDRLREGEYRDLIEGALAEFLGSHEGLRAFNDKRYQEELESVFGKDKPLEKILEKLLKKSPTLANLLGIGVQLKEKSTFDWKERTGKYRGKKFPTFFRLAAGEQNTKKCPQNQGIRFRFETNAENNYFIRTNKPGTFNITPPETKKNVRLWNGILELTAQVPPTAEEGERLKVNIELIDDRPSIDSSLPVVELELVVGPAVHRPKKGSSYKPSQESTESSRFKKTISGGEEEKKTLSLPKIVPLNKSDDTWHDHFESEYDATDPVPNAGMIDLFVNMDNPYLLSEVKVGDSGDKFVLENQFKYGLGLIALAMFYEQHNGKVAQTMKEENGDDNQMTVTAELVPSIKKATRAIAMVILPVTNNLSSITKTVIASQLD